MVERLNRIGPVLEIGRPGEKLGTTGSARLYVADDDWQSIAGELMERARLVVIRAGNTPGLRWELERVRRKLHPEKVALWFTDKCSNHTYAGLHQIAREALKCSTA